MCVCVLQEEVLHDVIVVGTAAVGQVTGSKNDDSVQSFTVVTCGI